MFFHLRIFSVKNQTVRITKYVFWNKRAYSCPTIQADLAIIGTGPAGVTAAMRAAQHGMKNIVCIDKSPLYGGTCVNHGCTPAKSLLKFSQSYKEAISGFLARQGVAMCGVQLDLCQMMNTKYKVCTDFSSFLEMAYKNKEIKVIKGMASICGCDKIVVEGCDGQTTFVEAKKTVIATGSEWKPSPAIQIDEERIVTSTGAMEFRQLPKRMALIGAGIISVEIGCIWARLGSEVTIYTDDTVIISRFLDAEIRERYQKILENQGIRFVFGVKLHCAARINNVVRFRVSDKKGKNQEIECDALMLSLGRMPHTCGLQLERIGMLPDKNGFIPVNKCYQTCVPNFFAIGDVTKGPMTAHKAIEDGVLMVDALFGRGVDFEHEFIPMVIYTHPEVACVGKNEEMLKEEKIPYKTARATFDSCTRAYTDLDTTGFIKTLICEKTGRILGTHIIGRHAGDYINEAVLAQQYGITAEHVSRVAHAHPTYAKMLKTIYSSFL